MTMRKFNYDEIVTLNQWMFFGTLYAAADDGIYRMKMKRAKVIKVLIAAITALGIVFVIMFLAIIGIVFLAAITISEMYSLVSRSLPDSFSYSTYWIPALISILTGVGLFAGSVYAITKYGTNKLVEIVGKMFGKIVNGLEGELVVPWSQVRTITVVKVRRIMTTTPAVKGSIPRLVTITIGDWHVLTTDGRDITIPNVYDPYNKLNYVKNRFNLNFS